MISKAVECWTLLINKESRSRIGDARKVCKEQVQAVLT